MKHEYANMAKQLLQRQRPPTAPAHPNPPPQSQSKYQHLHKLHPEIRQAVHKYLEDVKQGCGYGK